MHAGRARSLFEHARVARLATADAGGVPHLVPVTFAVLGDDVVFAIDHKPKTTYDLRRLRNIRANPRVSLLADHYDDDWTRLWWARADGTATIREPGHDAALRALAGKYEQYRGRPPEGPVVVVAVSRWSGWAYAG
ncbi:TIGR03668 family PPOX class F420-dependent oxidoreductase [Nonomuraea sp. WAC 01424]|uniref:TIGR03668 family PPOX class F420-dependent oxidoreductase n=1 Tax=Nonomuraea sp. WAC 01424 TaxID=2203200 RepID=UPI000F7A44E1|nr:TIGR03668 family PPOX class F420-dependent oxidoreductase [Nonomuraea sp. WAC 01424]RSM97635.1 TIGR03668 family PPOX class F420-dependent oxidoreductase [Nonomuraea sp. WAC 01424]